MKTVFYTVAHFLLYWPVRLLFRVRVRGSKNEPRRKEGPYLVCSNHQTVLDPVFICIATHRQQPHFMAKEELFRVPVLRRVVRWFGAYPVTRGRNAVGAVKHTVALIKDGRTVGMFPQGTRCPDRLPAECPIKSGIALVAAHTDVQILPMHIKMKNYHWKFFRRVQVTVGKPMKFADFHYQEGVPGEYTRIANEVYAEICRLGEEGK